MRILLAVVPREARDDAEAALESAGARGFTEISSVYGEGTSGARFGSRAAPGVSDLLFLAIEDDTVEPIRAALRSVVERHGRRLHAFLLSAERL